MKKKVDYIIHRESLMISLLSYNFSTEEDLKASNYLFDDLGNEVEHFFDVSMYR